MSNVLTEMTEVYNKEIIFFTIRLRRCAAELLKPGCNNGSHHQAIPYKPYYANVCTKEARAAKGLILSIIATRAQMYFVSGRESLLLGGDVGYVSSVYYSG